MAPPPGVSETLRFHDEEVQFLLQCKVQVQNAAYRFLKCQNGKISGIRLLFPNQEYRGHYQPQTEKTEAASCLAESRIHASFRYIGKSIVDKDCQSLRNFQAVTETDRERVFRQLNEKLLFFMPGSLFIFFVYIQQKSIYSQEVQSRTQVWLSDLERDSMSWISRDIRLHSSRLMEIKCSVCSGSA